MVNSRDTQNNLPSIFYLLFLLLLHPRSQLTWGLFIFLLENKVASRTPANLYQTANKQFKRVVQMGTAVHILARNTGNQHILRNIPETNQHRQSSQQGQCNNSLAYGFKVGSTQKCFLFYKTYIPFHRFDYYSSGIITSDS